MVTVLGLLDALILIEVLRITGELCSTGKLRIDSALGSDKVLGSTGFLFFRFDSLRSTGVSDSSAFICVVTAELSGDIVGFASIGALVSNVT